RGALLGEAQDTIRTLRDETAILKVSELPLQGGGAARAGLTRKTLGRRVPLAAPPVPAVPALPVTVVPGDATPPLLHPLRAAACAGLTRRTLGRRVPLAAPPVPAVPGVPVTVVTGEASLPLLHSLRAALGESVGGLRFPLENRQEPQVASRHSRLVESCADG